MRPQIIIGFYREGSTDTRFLESIIKRTFEDVCMTNLTQEIEILDLQEIKSFQTSFIDNILEAAQRGIDEYGITVLCIHADADSSTDANCFNNKINPALFEIKSSSKNLCKIIIPLVPVQMTESWMLADKELLKKELGTNKSYQDLEIEKDPESYANPKAIIENAIRKSRQDMTKRRRKELKIADLYLPIGQSIEIQKLSQLPSYKKFRLCIIEAFKQLNYLH